MATVIVGVVLLGIVILICFNLNKQRKNKKCNSSCGCGGCSEKDGCM